MNVDMGPVGLSQNPGGGGGGWGVALPVLLVEKNANCVYTSILKLKHAVLRESNEMDILK